MWAIVTKFIPPRYLIEAVAVVAAVVFYNVHVHNLEVRYAAKQVAAVRDAVTAASDKLIADAKAREDKQAADYATNLQQVNESYAKQVQASNATHAADLQRLRQLAAASHGGGDSALGGPAAPGAPADSGRSSLIGLGYVSAELAGALHDARDDLGKCYAERESVAGK
jgi:hypothetical protein